MKYQASPFSLARAIALALLVSSFPCDLAPTIQAAAQHSLQSTTIDTTLDVADPIHITLSGTSITADGSGVTISGSTATITAAGSYSVSGSLSDGQIIVAAGKANTVELILNGINITNTTSAPIYVQTAKVVNLVLTDGTSNYLTDASTYVYASVDEDEPNAALFSDKDLTISGGGTLTVTANYNDGITSKDNLTISGGTINVTAVDDGIRGKDSLIITGGTIGVTAGGDGLKADNDEDTTKGYVSISGGSISITAGGDGVDAETNLGVSAGTITITSGGGSTKTVADDASAKGLKGVASVNISGGTFQINAADDAIHSNQTITISDGTFTLATGDDGIHADTSLTIDGGIIVITTSYEGIESVTITINSGSLKITATDDGINVAGDITSDQEVLLFLPWITYTGDTTTSATSSDLLQESTSEASLTQSEGEGDESRYLYINGGSIAVYADGDGIDANGSIVMTDGTVLIHGPTQNMNGAIDYNLTFNISGGLLVGAGSFSMAMAPSTTSSQNSLLLNFSTSQSAGKLIHIQDSAGNNLLTFAPGKSYQSIAFSSPDLTIGTTYQVYLGGSASGTLTNGLYQSPTYTAGTKYSTFTVSSTVTNIGVGMH